MEMVLREPAVRNVKWDGLHMDWKLVLMTVVRRSAIKTAKASQQVFSSLLEARAFENFLCRQEILVEPSEQSNFELRNRPVPPRSGIKSYFADRTCPIKVHRRFVLTTRITTPENPRHQLCPRQIRLWRSFPKAELNRAVPGRSAVWY